MKRVLSILFVASLGLAVLFYYRSDLSTRVTSSNALASVGTLKEEIFHLASAEEVDFEPLLAGEIPAELRSATAVLPQWHHSDLKEARELLTYERECGSVPNGKRLRKAIQFAQARCQGKTLPVSFFEQGPFIHPSGKSFAALETKDNKARFSELRRFVHVLELSAFETSVFSSLRPEHLDYVSKRAATFLAPNYLYIRKKDTSGERDLGSVYVRVPLKDASPLIWQNSFLLMSGGAQSSCLVSEANTCWIWEPKALSEPFSIALHVLGLFLILSIAITLYQLFKLLRLRRVEVKARKFILETLTHELRTPLQVIQLLLERFREDFDRLPDRSQRVFLDLCDEMQRLTQMTQMSTCYLKERESSLFDWKVKEVECQPFFDSITERFGKDVIVRYSDEAGLISIDPFWVSFCIRNLIENGLRHGKPPVKVFVSSKNGSLSVTVEDEGTGFHSTKEKQPGLGIGLGLVRQVVSEMGGTIKQFELPTRVVLDFQGGSA